MSVYAVLDGDEEGGPQVGSITGWGDFIRWTDDLDDDEFQEIIHLAENGWSQNLFDLQSQMEKAGTEQPPDDEDTKDVCRTLLQVITDRGDAEVLTITDGLTPGDDESDEEEDDGSVDDEPEEKSRPPKTEALKSGARAVLQDCIRRLAHKEAMAVKEAAAKPEEFCDRIAKFCDKHESWCASELKLPLELCAAFGVNPDSAVMAAAIVAESKEAMLQVANGESAGMPQRAEAFVATWAARRSSSFVRSIAELN